MSRHIVKFAPKRRLHNRAIVGMMRKTWQMGRMSFTIGRKERAYFNCVSSHEFPDLPSHLASYRGGGLIMQSYPAQVCFDVDLSEEDAARDHLVAHHWTYVVAVK
jgi:hypothetical protein